MMHMQVGYFNMYLKLNASGFKLGYIKIKN